MKRGDIWTVASGVYASKPRPASIIQDNRYDATESVTVLPLTSTLVDAPLLRISIDASEPTGLQHASQVMIDKLTTVRRSNVREKVGRLSATQLVEVERVMLVFLGLAG